jgi:hypothetical protein
MSTPEARTSTATCPAPWYPSISDSAPASRAIRANAPRSCRKPVVKNTCEVARKAVRSSTTSANCSGSMPTPSSLRSTTSSTPGFTTNWCPSVGKSSSVITTFGRAPQSMLSATDESATDVDGESASSCFPAPRNEATCPLSASRRPIQCSYQAEAPISCQSSVNSPRRVSARCESAPSEHEFR